MLRKLFGSCVIAVLLAGPAALDAKDRHGKKGKGKEKDSTEWRYRTERDRYPRQTMRGHQPHDDNGDGVVTRNEWPGNDNSFRTLDRNGDGILSDADRRIDPKSDRIHDWQRRQ